MLSLLFLIIINALYLNYSKIIILKGQGKLSDETKQLLNSQSMVELGASVSQEITYNITDTDTNSKIQIIKNDFNGDIGAGQEEYLSSIRNHKVQSDTSVYMNYEVDSSVIPSTNYSGSELAKTACHINCTYSIREVVIYNMTEIIMKNDYKKYSHYSQFIIGLDNDLMYLIIRNTSSLLRNHDLQQPSILDNEKAEDFWIIKKHNQSINEQLIILTPTKVLVFNIVILNGKLFIDIKTTIERDILGISVIINSLGIEGDSYIFTTSTGIIIVSPNDTHTTSDYNGFDVQTLYPSVKFTDIIVLYSTIYANAQGKGLYIISMKNINNKNIIPISNIKQIDFIQNPFNGINFLGLLLDTMKKSDDFFIEYYIPYENHLYPVINKVFCSEFHHVSSFNTPDLFYSYFLNGNTIYVIRRGMLNIIPSLTLSLRIDYLINITSISEYYDNKNNGRIYPAMVGVNKIYPFQYSEVRHEINCISTKSGNYILIFKRLTDACQSNMGFNLKVCSKIIFYYFKVFGGEMRAEIRVAIIMSSVVFFSIAVGVIIYCIHYNNCFRDNRLKLVRTDNNNRADLYKDLDCNIPSIRNTEKHDIANINNNGIMLMNNNNDNINTEPVITIGRFISSRIPTTVVLETENKSDQTNVLNTKINSNQNLISIYHVASKNAKNR